MFKLTSSGLCQAVFGTVIGALLALAPWGSNSAVAQENCPRGTLDKQYCDRDGDLTADLPTNPSDWINPSTIIFSYTPVEDPAVYQKVWDGFISDYCKNPTPRVRRGLSGILSSWDRPWVVCRIPDRASS